MSAVLPFLFTWAIVYGLWKGVDVSDALICGARDGLETVFRILPSLVALLTAAAMFRASGALDFLCALFAPLLSRCGIPAELTPLLLLRPLSGSGALGVTSELIAAHGPDSLTGRMAAVMMGSTETTFYTIAVYYGAAGIRETRHTIPAALAADLTGFLAASFFVHLFF